MYLNKRVAIVGAGVGGLAFAGSLRAQQSGAHIEIFESRPKIEGLGAGLTLWPNATGILKKLGILNRCLENSGALRSLTVQSSDGRRIMKIPVENFSTPAIALHRRHLHDAMMSKVTDVPTHLGAQCLGAREDTTGAHLIFADGERGPFDLVIAADGIHSKLREYVHGHQPLKYLGYRIWRGIADGKNLLRFDGEFFETWGRGLRFGILPMGNGQVCWYASHNQDARDPRSLHEQKTNLQELFKDWVSPIEELVERTPLSALLPADAFVRKPVLPWARGRVILVGDAAHPVAANLGLGGNLAIEDGWVLGQLTNARLDHEAVLSRYQKLRHARTTAVFRRANFVGSVGQMDFLSPARNWICRQIPGRLFTRTSRALHAYDPDSAKLGKTKVVQPPGLEPGTL